jgi:hypothetical protein
MYMYPLSIIHNTSLTSAYFGLDIFIVSVTKIFITVIYLGSVNIFFHFPLSVVILSLSHTYLPFSSKWWQAHTRYFFENKTLFVIIVSEHKWLHTLIFFTALISWALTLISNCKCIAWHAVNRTCNPVYIFLTQIFDNKWKRAEK